MIEFEGKEREEKVVSLYKEIVENNQGVDFDKLNLIKLDYSFRTRSEEIEDKKIKVIDRGFLELKGEKVGSNSLIDLEKTYLCFVYGKRTIGFIMDFSQNKIFANVNLRESSDFNVLLLNFIKEKGVASCEFIEGLQTGAVKKAKQEKSLEDCIIKARSLEEIESELGF